MPEHTIWRGSLWKEGSLALGAFVVVVVASAYAFTLAQQGGGTSFSGHFVFITSEGNISAHDGGAYGKPGQFEYNPDNRHRRYTGD